jgi:hypothetical protein
MTSEIQPGDRLAYALAGRSVVTLQGRESRFTFRIERNDREDARATHYVYVLNGPDNERDYRFVGGITAEGFYRSEKSPIGADAPSVQAFAWWWRHVESPDVTVYHAGTCGRCGRMLTTPESIRTGLGPVCAERAS